MTWLSIGRTIELPAQSLSTSSITEPSSPTFDKIEDFKSFVKRKVGGLQFDYSLKSFMSYVPMYGRGPNGPALKTCI